MSQLGMNSALWAVYTSAENTEMYQNDPLPFLGQFDLSETERTALTERDWRALLESGAHPFLMFKTALRLMGPVFSMEFMQAYITQLTGAELRDIIT